MGKGKGSRKKGMRRAYLKNFSSAMINTGRSVDNRTRGRMDDDYPKWATFSPRARNLAAANFSPLPVEPHQENINAIKQAHEGKPYPRGLVLLKLWQGQTRRQGVEEIHCIVLQQTKRIKLSLFFHGTEFIFAKEDRLFKRRSFSIVYGSRDRAMHAFRINRIVFAESLKMTQEEETNNVPPNLSS